MNPGITMVFEASDDLCFCFQVRLDRNNLLAFDQYVGIFEVADAAVHRQDGAAFDEDPAVPAALNKILRACRLRRAGRHCAYSGGDKTAHTGFEEVAARPTGIL
jgi:hypothetical protein